MRIPGAKQVLSAVFALSLSACLSGCDSTRPSSNVSSNVVSSSAEAFYPPLPPETTESIPAAQQRVSAGGTSFQNVSDLGFAYYKAKKYREAASMFEQALALSHQSARPLQTRYLGYCYLALGRNGDAIRLYKDILTQRIGPEDASDFQLSLGNIYLADKKLPAARSAYELSIKLNSRQGSAYQGLGQIYAFEGNRTDAINSIKLALRYAETEHAASKAHACLGKLYDDIGKHSAAEAEYTLSLQLDPNNPLATRALGTKK